MILLVLTIEYQLYLGSTDLNMGMGERQEVKCSRKALIYAMCPERYLESSKARPSTICLFIVSLCTDESSMKTIT